jgi:uncharacterized membrane protein
MQQSKTREHMAFERLLFFSDAVFAIAITLLVIEIKIPAVEPGSVDSSLPAALLQIIPKIIGFFISFLLIGQTWIEHHRICLFIEGFNSGLLWKNLWLLLFVAFLPFTTAVMSEYYYSHIAVSLYAVSFAALGLAKASFWRYAVRCKLLAHDADPYEVKRISRRVWATPLTCIIVMIAAMFKIPYSYFGFMLIPLAAIILDRTAPRKKSS